ncbi:MAG: hypothetical protein ACRDJI_08865, partial [Actinomycetota bacterium]
GAYQSAVADWLVFEDRDTATLYFALGFHSTGDDGLGTYGAVGKGECQVTRGRNFTAIMCVGSGKMKQIPLEDFDFDPMLSSARLAVGSGGFDHVIEWTSRGDPAPGGSVGWAGTFVHADAGVSRDARASGTVFGKRLAGSRYAMAFLDEGAGGAAYAVSGRSVEITDDGRVAVRASYRLPRN